MHYKDDLGCNRGYEFWLLEQARARNPAIKTYALSWAVRDLPLSDVVVLSASRCRTGWAIRRDTTARTTLTTTSSGCSARATTTPSSTSTTSATGPRE